MWFYLIAKLRIKYIISFCSSIYDELEDPASELEKHFVSVIYHQEPGNAKGKTLIFLFFNSNENYVFFQWKTSLVVEH